MEKRIFTPVLLMLSLGYMIDFFDLTIFAAARGSILKDLGISTENAVHVSTQMFNAQAIGILFGGLLSGMWGDKIGRMSSVRIGIFIYSTAILANVFVHSLPAFLCLRFLSGFGLAGELAASISLSSEIFSAKERGWASGTIYFFGVLGGILATFIGSYFHWKVLFAVGGIAGYMLLALRIGFGDSQLFSQIKANKNVTRGNLKLLLLNKSSLKRVISLTLIVVPFWFMAFFVNFAPEVAKGVGMKETASQSISLACYFIGSLIGSYFFPFLADFFFSRKKSILIALFMMISSVCLFSLGKNLTLNMFYSIFLILGAASGYTSIYMTLAAENFGINQRATATAFVSCLSRSSLILINAFVPYMVLVFNDTWFGAIISCSFVFIISILALFWIRETHGKSTDFIEESGLNVDNVTY
jgi:MFS family permease